MGPLDPFSALKNLMTIWTILDRIAKNVSFRKRIAQEVKSHKIGP
jgi:hypothetical protein